jgi:hypothetical protein
MKDTAEAWLQPVRPQYFRLPPPGEADPHFGFSRSFYYCGEQRGWWRLIRLCSEGKSRGVTVVSFGDVLAFVRARAAESNSDFDTERGTARDLERGRPEELER